VGIGTSIPQSRLDVRGTASTLIRTESSSTIGTWINLTNTAGGRSWNIISSGSGNGEGAGKLMFFDQTGFATRMTIDEIGNVAINVLGEGGGRPLCRNDFNQISDCSSSIRYKHNINSFRSGLSLIKQLRPVSFNWRANNQADFGLVAEEVNRVEPLLTTTNEKGEIEGVKYDRVGVVLVNAVQEQQTQIDSLEKQNQAQQKQIERQQKQIDSLKQIVCSMNPQANICK
jgi:hypothetical protein